jgi:hypothetical protein
MYTLEKRNNKAYLVMSDFDTDLPRIISSFFPINIDPDLIPENFNRGIEQFGNAYIFHNGYRVISFFVTSENGYPEFTEFAPVKPPKKKGYIWKWGEWKKQ